jgi:hypothetical protein
MLTWIIQIFIISILFISLVHHLIYFLKNTLTVPKIKDLVSSSSKKYENIYSVVRSNVNEQNNHYSDIDLLKPVLSMKDELKHFFKNQMKEEICDTTDISNIDSLSYI